MKRVVRKQLAPMEIADQNRQDDNFLDPNLANVIPLSSLGAASSSTSSSNRRADYDNERPQMKSRQNQAFVPRIVSTKKRLGDDLVVEHIAPRPSDSDGSDSNDRTESLSKSGSGKKEKYQPEGMHAAVPETVGSSGPVNYNRIVQSRLMQKLSKNQGSTELQPRKQYNVHNEAFYGMEASEATEAVKTTADPKYAYLFNGFKPGKGVKFMGRKNKFNPKTKPQSEKAEAEAYERPSFSGAQRGQLEDKMLDALVKTRRDRFDKMMRPKLDESSYEPLSPTESELDDLDSEPPLTKRINETFNRLLKEVHVTSEQRINELSAEMKKVFVEFTVPSTERKVLFEEQLQKLIKAKNWKALNVTTAVCHAATASSEPLVSREMNQNDQEFFCLKSNCHLSYPKEKFPCFACSQKFTTVVDRYVHEKDNHGRVNQSQFPCPVPSCREAFNMNPNALRAHFYSKHLCVDEHDECSFGCKILIPKTHSRSVPDHVYSVHACQICNDVLSCPLSEHMVTFHDTQYGKSSTRTIPKIPLDPNVNLKGTGIDDGGNTSTSGNSGRSRNSRFSMYNNDIPFSGDSSPTKSFPDITYGCARNKNNQSDDRKSPEGKDVLQDYLSQARAVSTINNNLIEDAKNILEKQPIFESEYKSGAKTKSTPISISLNRSSLEQDLDGEPMVECEISQNQKTYQNQRFKSTFKVETVERRNPKVEPIELVSGPGTGSSVEMSSHHRGKSDKLSDLEHDVMKLAESRRCRSSIERQNEDDRKHGKHSRHSTNNKKRKMDTSYGSCSNDGKKARKRSRSRDSSNGSPRSSNSSDHFRNSKTFRKSGKRSKSRHRSSSRGRRSRSRKRSRSRSKGRSPKKHKVKSSRGENRRLRSRSKSREGNSDVRHQNANRQKDKPKFGFTRTVGDKSNSNQVNVMKSVLVEASVDRFKSQPTEKAKTSPSKVKCSIPPKDCQHDEEDTSKVDVNNLVIEQGVLEALNTIAKRNDSQGSEVDGNSQNDGNDIVDDELDGLLELGNSTPVSDRAVSPISDDELSRSPAPLPEFKPPEFTFQEKSKWARCRICNYSCPQNGGFECSQCQNSKFVLISDLLLHVKNAHSLVVRLPDKIDCDFCGTVFGDVKKFDEHLKEKHLCTDKHVQCTLGCNGLFSEKAISFHAQQKHNVIISSSLSTVKNDVQDAVSQKADESNEAESSNNRLTAMPTANKISVKDEVCVEDCHSEKSPPANKKNSGPPVENIDERRDESDTRNKSRLDESSDVAQTNLPSNIDNYPCGKEAIPSEPEKSGCQSKTCWSKEPDLTTSDADVGGSAEIADKQESHRVNHELHPKLNLKFPKRASRFSGPPKSSEPETLMLVDADSNLPHSSNPIRQEVASEIVNENSSDSNELNEASKISSDSVEPQVQTEVNELPLESAVLRSEEVEKSLICDKANSNLSVDIASTIDISCQEQMNRSESEPPDQAMLDKEQVRSPEKRQSSHDLTTSASNCERVSGNEDVACTSDASTEILDPLEYQDEIADEDKIDEQDGVLDLSCSSVHNSNDEIVDQGQYANDQNLDTNDNDPDIIFVGQCLDLTAVVSIGKKSSAEDICKKEPTDDSDSYLSRSSDSQDSRSPNKILSTPDHVVKIKVCLDPKEEPIDFDGSDCWSADDSLDSSCSRSKATERPKQASCTAVCTSNILTSSSLSCTGNLGNENREIIETADIQGNLESTLSVPIVDESVSIGDVAFNTAVQVDAVEKNNNVFNAFESPQKEANMSTVASNIFCSETKTNIESEDVGSRIQIGCDIRSSLLPDSSSVELGIEGLEQTSGDNLAGSEKNEASSSHGEITCNEESRKAEDAKSSKAKAKSKTTANKSSAKKSKPEVVSLLNDSKVQKKKKQVKESVKKKVVDKLQDCLNSEVVSVKSVSAKKDAKIGEKKTKLGAVKGSETTKASTIKRAQQKTTAVSNKGAKSKQLGKNLKGILKNKPTRAKSTKEIEVVDLRFDSDHEESIRQGELGSSGSVHSTEPNTKTEPETCDIVSENVNEKEVAADRNSEVLSTNQLMNKKGANPLRPNFTPIEEMTTDVPLPRTQTLQTTQDESEIVRPPESSTTRSELVEIAINVLSRDASPSPPPLKQVVKDEEEIPVVRMATSTFNEDQIENCDRTQSSTRVDLQVTETQAVVSNTQNEVVGKSAAATFQIKEESNDDCLFVKSSASEPANQELSPIKQSLLQKFKVVNLSHPEKEVSSTRDVTLLLMNCRSVFGEKQFVDTSKEFIKSQSKEKLIENGFIYCPKCPLIYHPMPLICKHCSLSFVDYIALEYHLGSKHKGPLDVQSFDSVPRCQFCDKFCDSYDDLFKHRASHYCNEHIECSFGCSKLLSGNVSTLKEHLKKKHTMSMPNIDDLYLGRLSSDASKRLELLTRSDPLSFLVCSDCEKMAINENNKEYECTRCEAGKAPKIYVQDDFLIHLEEEHGKKALGDFRCFACPSQEQSFKDNLKDLISHRYISHGICHKHARCIEPECKAFMHAEGLTAHLQFECKIFKPDKVMKEQPYEHLEHEVVKVCNVCALGVVVTDTYKCNEKSCNAYFPDEREFYAHMTYDHNLPVTIPENVDYACNACEQHASRNDISGGRWRQHRLKNHGICKMHVICPNLQCQLLFPSVEERDKHLENSPDCVDVMCLETMENLGPKQCMDCNEVKLETKVYTCQLCRIMKKKGVFTSNPEFMIHMSSKHNKVFFSPIHCNICDTIYLNTKDAYKHFTEYHNYCKIHQFCPQTGAKGCSYLFSVMDQKDQKHECRKAVLEKVLTNALGQQKAKRTLNCEDCGLSASVKQMFVCKYEKCEQEFISAVEEASHRISEHKLTVTTTFYCNECPKGTYRAVSSLLAQHLKLKHKRCKQHKVCPLEGCNGMYDADKDIPEHLKVCRGKIPTRETWNVKALSTPAPVKKKQKSPQKGRQLGQSFESSSNSDGSFRSENASSSKGSVGLSNLSPLKGNFSINASGNSRVVITTNIGNGKSSSKKIMLALTTLFDCKHCPRSVWTRELIQCLKCPPGKSGQANVFVNKEDFNVHLSKFHKQKITDVFACSTCDANFPNDGAKLLEHMSSRHKLCRQHWVCQKCGLLLPKEEMLHSHQH